MSTDCPKWCEAGARGSSGKGCAGGLVEEVGLKKDAEEAMELEKQRERVKSYQKKLTPSPKEAEGHLKGTVVYFVI